MASGFGAMDGKGSVDCRVKSTRGGEDVQKGFRLWWATGGCTLLSSVLGLFGKYPIHRLVSCTSYMTYLHTILRTSITCMCSLHYLTGQTR